MPVWVPRQVNDGHKCETTTSNTGQLEIVINACFQRDVVQGRNGGCWQWPLSIKQDREELIRGKECESARQQYKGQSADRDWTALA